ncbi:MAG: M23 family metallopeptidase, partial [Frankiaceae bacterium]|nr:M23 family metallopeptidase [Frankiaceae bacterium]
AAGTAWAAAGGASAAAPTAEVRYALPAAPPAPILRGFDAVGRYDPGHRGVDLGVSPGAVALAAADGDVVFAGPVAGRGVVVLAHADGIRTTYEPVAPAVAVGQRVLRGDGLGQVVGTHGPFPEGSALHWGARRGEDYVDPLALLRRLGPVRLVP